MRSDLQATNCQRCSTRRLIPVVLFLPQSAASWGRRHGEICPENPARTAVRSNISHFFESQNKDCWFTIAFCAKKELWRSTEVQERSAACLVARKHSNLEVLGVLIRLSFIVYCSFKRHQIALWVHIVHSWRWSWLRHSELSNCLGGREPLGMTCRPVPYWWPKK